MDDPPEVLLSKSFPELGLRSVKVMADGNCLPRVGSLLSFGHEANHVEMRVRIAHELITHDSKYLGVIDTDESLIILYRYFGGLSVTSQMSWVQMRFLANQIDAGIVITWPEPNSDFSSGHVITIPASIWFARNRIWTHDIWLVTLSPPK